MSNLRGCPTTLYTRCREPYMHNDLHMEFGNMLSVKLCTEITVFLAGRENGISGPKLQQKKEDPQTRGHHNKQKRKSTNCMMVCLIFDGGQLRITAKTLVGREYSPGIIPGDFFSGNIPRGISKGFASAAGPVACSLLNSCKVAGYLGGVFLERNFGVFGSAAKNRLRQNCLAPFFQTICA